MSNFKFSVLIILFLLMIGVSTYSACAILDAIDILDVRMSMACGAMIGDE